ncbi:MAG: DedA family protein [Candidatus Levybacteria bacterium]|nr:DedA family protein [Candidatus Levybacteria bacterium]
MRELFGLLHQYLDVQFLISTFGYPGVFAIVFAETGLMLGFFLPGDSLLITAGIFAAKGYLDVFVLCILLFIAATLGNTVGYFFGHKVGRRLFNREDSVLFHKKHIENAQKFYKDHGGKAIIIARFIPIIRTFAPIVAGIAQMDLKIFMIYNVIGSLLWAVGLTLCGYYLGKFIPDKYFELIIFFVIIVSLLPAVYHGINTKSKRQRIFAKISLLLHKK